MTAKLVIVMGVSGTGKSTLAISLADRLGFPVIDGDDHHPKGNIDKMSRGEALDDQDRLPWLSRLREIGVRKLQGGTGRGAGSGSELERDGHGKCLVTTEEDVGAVLVCSSLKRFYRQILRGKLEVAEQVPSDGETTLYEVREASPPPLPVSTCFVWIKGDKETLKGRLLKRQGHFFKANMLDSQFEALEPPEGEPDVVPVPLEPPTEEQTEIALKGLREISEA